MSKKKYLFQKLTPVHNADISVYEEAIDFVFDNTDVTNIAISGAYSAGKSSILESYKEQHKKLKFIHISLAHFRTPEQDGEKEDIKESVLEGKILNQLIHQIPTDRIPQTNFRVKKEVSKKNLIETTLVICLLLGSIIFMTLSGKLVTFVSGLSEGWLKNVLSLLTNVYASLATGVVGVICSVVGIYNIIKIQKNKNIFHKISIQGNEIEIFESQEDSYFDKYLNEVLYLFESVDADVIVFEDMDRFNASRIFERLREVNTLTNIQRRNKCKKQDDGGNNYKPLRFFYLLRDDIFITKDRTKFFDYIIPVVPVLDGSNSYEQFIKHLKQGNILDKFDAGFLQRLSLYIDDMRVLKNVYNEFIVYMYRLDNTDLDWNKMLAMIVYKNLFPRDFSDLQLAKGYVHELFEQKESLAQETQSLLENQRSEVIVKIERMKSETLTSIQELNDAYDAKYNKLPKRPYNNSYLSEEGEKQKAKLEIEKNLRKEAIQDCLDENLPSYEAKLSEIEHEIIVTKTKLLNELVTRDNMDDVFMIISTNAINDKNEFKEIKGSDYFDLLKFLVLYGYIDETYNDYMTYFYEESLSANDKTFLRRITDKRGADYEYSLREVQKVLASPVLRVVDFSEQETLNYDLLNGLVINQGVPKYQKYLSTLVEQIKKRKLVDFVSKFYDSEQFVDEFIIKLNEQWPEFASYVIKSKTMRVEQVRRYSLDTLRLSNEEILTQINNDKCLQQYISNADDYLEIDNPDVGRMISQLIVLQVSFKTIDFTKSNKKLFDEVYENQLFEFTFQNVCLMLRVEYEIENDEDIVHKNYTLIQSKEGTSLARYISLNMQLYSEIIIENCNGIISDDESIVILLLNNNEVETDTKVEYIQLIVTLISDITKISDTDLWKSMLVKGIVNFSVSNFINYFKEYGLQQNLCEFINKTHVDVDFANVTSEFGADIAEKLFDAIVISNDIETNKYRKILNDLRYSFDNYEATDISDEKMRILIEDRIIEMSVESLQFMRENYEDDVIYFIKHNIEDYLGMQTADIFSFEEAVQIIEFDINEEKKIELLGFTNNQISVVNKDYSDELGAYIIINNLDSGDLDYLYENYLQFKEKTRSSILSRAINNAANIIGEESILDDKLLSDLLTTSNLNRNIKVQLFNISIPQLNEETCKNHFDELELPDLKGIFTKRNTTSRGYEKNEEVLVIFEALKKNTWINDFYESDENPEQYIVLKNAPRSKTPEFLD